MAQASAVSSHILGDSASYPSTMLRPTAATQPVPALGIPPGCRPAYTPLPVALRRGGYHGTPFFLPGSVPKQAQVSM